MRCSVTANCRTSQAESSLCVCVCVCYCGAPTCEQLCTETESPLVRLTELRNVITQLSLSGCTMMLLLYIDVHSSL